MVHKAKASVPEDDELSTEGMIRFYGDIASGVVGTIKKSRSGSGTETEAEVSVSMDGGHDA